MKQLRRNAFRKWLEAKEPESVVGYTGKSLCCPIARYLNESGVGKHYVGTRYREFFLSRKTLYDPQITPLRKWARSFVAGIDSLPPANGGPRPVQAREAIEVLNSIGD